MLEQVVLGGGCFWCLDAAFREIRGVSHVESGYAGGSMPNPTYRDVCSGATGHAEVVRVEFDPGVISRKEVLGIFFGLHDPTTLNRQGGDVGTQYRSVVFYRDEEERALATLVIEELTRDQVFADPVVTTLEPLTEFYPGEEYHQDYLRRYNEAGTLEKLSFNAGYCDAVVNPKVAKFREKFRHLLK